MSNRYEIIDERKKRELVCKYNSGTRAKDICRQNNIPLSSFYSWVNKYQKITKRKESKNQITAMDYAELKRSRDRLAMEVEILQSVISNQNLKQIRKFELMEPLYGKYPLRTLCNAMQVRHASFYNHMVNNKNEHGWKYAYREKMKNEIQKLMAEDGHIHGATMIVDRLAQKGIKTSRRFVSELLSELGVRSANSKSYEYKKRIQELRKANKVATQLLADAPNKVWLTDCTQCYIHDRDVWVCAVIDLYSRKLLAMKVGRNNSTRLTKSTLQEAIKARKPQNLRLHSDQGANYTSYRFNSFLKENNISHTYSRSGMPKDNAPMESFFKTFKDIEIWSKDFPSYEGLKRRINEEYGFDDESDNDTTESNIKLTGNGELRLTDIKRYINSLKELIPHWYTTFNPSTVTNPEIAKYLFRLNTLGYINSRPLVTVILSKSTISDADRIECLKLIERFNFLHYRLNGYFATYSNSTFYNLARDLYYNKIGLDEVLEVVSRIDFLSDNNVVTSHGIIDKFEKLSKRDGFYSWGSLKFLLYIYDLSLTKTDSEKKINPDEYFKQEPKDHCSIEHIYPQKGTDKYWSDRFDKYSPNERKRLNGSLGNMLALSARINSKLQNRSFDSKIQERYSSGSKSELMVAAWPSKEWTPESILERGMEILHFIEKEFDFVFPNDKYRKEVLGLGFMVNEGDEDSNKTVAITESADEKITSQEFKAEDFEKLSSGANKELLDIFETINDYCLSISQNIIRNTTKHYIGYSEGKSFADFHFNSGYCHLMLRTIKYSDPQNKIELLGDNYNWAKKAKLRIYPGDDLEYIKGLIKQSYDSLFNN